MDSILFILLVRRGRWVKCFTKAICVFISLISGFLFHKDDSRYDHLG